jgi:rod shape-determining protein MreC
METSRDDFIIAIRSAFLKKGTQQRFSLLGLIFFSVIILILGSYNFKVVNLVKISIKEIVYRSSFIVSGPEKIIATSINKVADHISHYHDYLIIEKKLNELESKDLSNQIITLENKKYKKLVDDFFITNNEIFAKVLIDKNSPFLRSVVLNKGSKNNIKLGMAVLDGEYLIGKVVEVNFFTSRVLLLSDINSKIPVSVSPDEIQAIMSGDGKQNATLQYIKGTDLKNKNEDKIVSTSGAGGIFKSGILIGKIFGHTDSTTDTLKVDIFKDFTQLKYVKVVSFTKEIKALDQKSEKELKTLDNQIIEATKQKENIRILLEEKKIAEEVRKNIEEENSYLKTKVLRLENELTVSKKFTETKKIEEQELNFLKLNLLHGHKCRKTLFKNQLFKVGTVEYKDCVLKKGNM